MKKILAIMACFALMFSLNFVNAEQYTRVPDIIGKEYSQAETEIEKARLVPVITNSSGKFGKVIKQEPSRGTRLVVGTEVSIVLSNYPSAPDSGNEVISGITNLADRIWATAITIIQAIAVGCVVFAGLRYMYASAEKKADIKKGMMYLAIGAIFVFATTTVIRFIYSAGSSLL